MGAARETEDFAAYLGRLRQRSGRSYAALARRLHTSTSTLHRYCSGKAVPTQYAPVERLARLCGATPDELLELHRLWVRADAARGRTEQEPRPRQAPRPDPAPDLVPESEPVPEAVPEPGPAAPSVPHPPPVPPASPAPPGRRRMPLRSAAVVLTVALAAVTAAALGSDSGPSAPNPSPASAPAATGAGPTGGPGAGTSPSSSGSVSASPSALPASSPSAPAAGAAGSGEPGGAPGTDPARSPGRGPGKHTSWDGAPGTAPLNWTVRSHVWAHGCDHRYLVPLPPSRVPPPPVEQDAPGWARSLGAVHGGSTNVEVTVWSAGPTPVVVEALHIRVVARRTPLAWSSFAMGDGCGGSLTPAAFSVGLDAPRPLARPLDGYDGDGGKPLPATRLPYRVSTDDPLALRIEARTERCDCDWYVELEWSSGNDSGTVRVDDGGRPFRTSGTEGRPEYNWDLASGTWWRG